MNLDWNPNIIQQLHPVSSIAEQLRQHALIDRQAPNLVKMADDFTLAYNAARSVVKNKAALAFRLDLAATPAPVELDPTAPMQIGGLPDLAGAINSSAAYAVHEKRTPSWRNWSMFTGLLIRSQGSLSSSFASSMFMTGWS